MRSSAAGSYVLFQHRGLPILAVPDTKRSEIVQGVRAYVPGSCRRAIYRRGILLAAHLCGPRTLGTKTDLAVPFAPNFPFQAFVRELSRVLAMQGVRSVLTFPSELSRRRFYVTLLSPSGTPRVFVKVSMGDASFAGLIQEAELSESLAHDAVDLFRVPHVLHYGEFEGVRYIAMEALPPGVHRLKGNWNDRLLAISDFFSERVPHRQVPVASLPWWEGFRMVGHQVPALFRLLALKSEEQTDVGFAHGDFHRGNLYVEGGRLWIIDWEHSSSAAPALVDRTRFYLGDHARELVRHPQKVVAGLLEHFGAQTAGEEHRRVANAIAFLCSRRNGAGLLCGSNWPDLTDRR